MLARHWADKHGCIDSPCKLVRLATNCDRDPQSLCAEFFPHAEHTVDSITCSNAFTMLTNASWSRRQQTARRWFDDRRAQLRHDRAKLNVAELRQRLLAISRSGSSDGIAAVPGVRYRDAT